MEPEYETVWSGATWRDIPPPADLVLAQKPPAVRVSCGTYKTVLLNILTEGWSEVRMVKYYAEQRGMEAKRVRDYLARLVDDGRIEHDVIYRRSPETGKTNAMHFYRRVRPAQEAAA